MKVITIVALVAIAIVGNVRAHSIVSFWNASPQRLNVGLFILSADCYNSGIGNNNWACFNSGPGAGCINNIDQINFALVNDPHNNCTLWIDGVHQEDPKTHLEIDISYGGVLGFTPSGELCLNANPPVTANPVQPLTMSQSCSMCNS